MTVDQALNHPYLSSYVSEPKVRSPEYSIDHTIHAQHDPEDEPVVASLDPEYFEFDSELLPQFCVWTLSYMITPITVHKEDLSKDQLKGTQVSCSVDPVS